MEGKRNDPRGMRVCARAHADGLAIFLLWPHTHARHRLGGVYVRCYRIIINVVIVIVMITLPRRGARAIGY